MIRRATAADLPHIAEIRFAVRENRLSDPSRVPPEMVLWFLDHPGLRVWDEDARIRGFSAHDPRDGSIWALFVHPDDECRGIGSALLSREIELLRATGVPRIWLTTDPASGAAGFYRRRGFAFAGLTPTGAGGILVRQHAFPTPCG